MNSTTHTEPVIEPELPIVDSHHHLWYLPPQTLAEMETKANLATSALLPTYRHNARYLLDEYLADLGTGHLVCASVFVDARAMYRASGPDMTRSLGEVEFANGVSAMAASGAFGESKVCAAIVGNVDLRIGDAAEGILMTHIQAGGGRYRGIRCPHVVYDPDHTLLGPGVGIPHLLLDSKFRAGFKRLQKLGLSFDAWLLEPQLPDLIDLAHTFPETPIVLDHVGAPVGIAAYRDQREARFSLWRENIRRLSRCDNVFVKLGGLGIPFGGFPSFMATPRATSERLAQEWKPYIETSIEAFGPHRCMFESNFPVDSATCTYRVLWNTFKRLVSGSSTEDKTALFSGTATHFYKLNE